MTTSYLLLGANLGNRLAQLSQAIEQIGTHVGRVVEKSGIYETEAWGNEGQPTYLNQVIAVDTYLDAEAVLQLTQQIELNLGRVRLEKWGSRVIDIDILFFGQQVIDRPKLTVPHPLFPLRRFALTPMHEIAPDFVHPLLRKSVKQLLQETPDSLSVNNTRAIAAH